MKWYIIASLAAAAVGILVGCAVKAQNNTDNGYTQITRDEAKEMMKKDDGHIIVDVRRPDEYAGGHIPEAICIPNETISNVQPEELPDLQQIILIYCRSGNRSKQASQKLSDMGYTNVYEFGGIIDWTGEIVTDESSNTSDTESKTDNAATLVFESFDGGGYEYTVTLEDPSLISYTEKHSYSNKDHTEQDGSSYDVVFSFTGLKAGETMMKVNANSPIIGDEEYSYKVTVDRELNVTITETETEPDDPTYE